jgi:hypothetical protein
VVYSLQCGLPEHLHDRFRYCRLFICDHIVFRHVVAMTNYLLPSPPVPNTNLIGTISRPPKYYQKSPTTPKVLQKKYTNKRQQKRRTKRQYNLNIIISKNNLPVVLKQPSISYCPNLGIHHPPGSSSSNPLSRTLRPISVQRRY